MSIQTLKRRLIWLSLNKEFKLNKTINYIKTLFDVDIILKPKIKFKKSGKFENIRLDFFKYNNNKFIGYILPKDKLLIYDIKNKEIIENNEVIEELKNILLSVKNMVFDEY